MALGLQEGENATTDVLELEGGETFVAADTGDADELVGEIPGFKNAEGVANFLDEVTEGGDDPEGVEEAGAAGLTMDRRQALNLLLAGFVTAAVLPNGGCKKDEEKKDYRLDQVPREELLNSCRAEVLVKDVGVKV